MSLFGDLFDLFHITKTKVCVEDYIPFLVRCIRNISKTPISGEVHHIPILNIAFIVVEISHIFFHNLVNIPSIL